MTLLRTWIERWAALGRRWRGGAVLLWAALIWWSSSRPASTTSGGLAGSLLQNGAHVVVFAVLGALLLLALHGLALHRRCALAWLVAALYGVVDELHQSWVPSRHASVGDVLSDAAGAVIGVALTQWLWRGEVRAGRIAAAAMPVAFLCVGVETFWR